MRLCDTETVFRRSKHSKGNPVMGTLAINWNTRFKQIVLNKWPRLLDCMDLGQTWTVSDVEVKTNVDKRNTHNRPLTPLVSSKIQKNPFSSKNTSEIILLSSLVELILIFFLQHFRYNFRASKKNEYCNWKLNA